MSSFPEKRKKGGIFLLIKTTLFIFCLCVLLGRNPGIVQAIGVSPGTITIPNVTNGLVISKKIRVTSPSKNASVTFKSEVVGEGASYINLSSSEITIPLGQNYVDFSFEIKPVNAPNGNHKAFLVFTTTQGNRSNDAVGITTFEGATAEIDFTVTNAQVEQFTVGGLTAEPIETTNAPTFTFNIINDGNVNAKPDEIKVTITDRNHNILSQETLSKDLFPVTAPGQTQTITVSTSKKLPPGTYYLSTSFFHNGIDIFDKKDILFSVSPEGTLMQEGELQDLTVTPSDGPPGTLLKIDGIFFNSGTVGAEPAFFVQVAKDGKIIDTLQSKTQFVGTKRAGKFSVTYHPDSPGTYIFTGYFSYGIKETERKNVSAEITSLVSNLLLTSWLKGCSPNPFFLSLVIFSVAMTLLWVHYFRLWRKHKKCICSSGCDCHGPVKPISFSPSQSNSLAQPFPTPSVTPTLPPLNEKKEKSIEDELYS